MSRHMIAGFFIPNKNEHIFSEEATAKYYKR